MRYKIGIVTYDSLARAIDALTRDWGVPDVDALRLCGEALDRLCDSNGARVVDLSWLIGREQDKR